jgi:hypothetical protein
MDFVLLVSVSVLGLGLYLGWLVLVKPLKEKVRVLQRVIALDSAQKMGRVLTLEAQLRLEKKRVQELESELKWKTAKTLALESDLERVQSKLMWKE